MAVFCQSIFLPYTTSVRLTLLKLDKCKVVYGLNKRLFCLPDTPYTSISFLNFFFLKGVGKGVSSVRWTTDHGPRDTYHHWWYINQVNRKHQKGFISHIQAIKFLSDQGYYVFDNLSSLGPCDLVGINEYGEILLVDVKSTSIRKSGKYKGYLITRTQTDLQKKLKIRILMVDEEGNCTLK